MTQITAARIALTALIALGLTGCTGTAEEAPTEPRSFAQSVPSDADDATATETPEPAETNSLDDGYLATVDEKMRDVTVLDKLTDAELIELGHDACDQIGAGTPPEDLRLVDGEQPNDYGYWLDTSTIFNSALLNYCPELIEEVP